MREILLDSDKTGFIFVLNPERLPILETEKAVSLLGRHHLHVRTLVINKVLPEEADGVFLRERKLHEREYLELIAQTFKEQELICVPLFPGDIVSMADLEAFSQHFKAGGQIEGIRL